MAPTGSMSLPMAWATNSCTYRSTDSSSANPPAPQHAVHTLDEHVDTRSPLGYQLRSPASPPSEEQPHPRPPRVYHLGRPAPPPRPATAGAADPARSAPAARR